MKKYLLIFFLACNISNVLASNFSISIPENPKKIPYAVSKLKEALLKNNHTLTLKKPQENADIIVRQNTNLEKEGFELKNTNSSIQIFAPDEQGMMYGILELARQLRLGGNMSTIRPVSVLPKMHFRAIKFNLPYMAYRTDASITQHDWTCRDPKFWEAYLDNMVENRFNVLSLWSLHLFHYMVKPHNFPEATHYNDFEMGEWKIFWKNLFRMAHERGIETYIINWNTFVSPSFAAAHNVGRYNEKVSHFGSGDTSKITEKYTREIITQVINEYEDLDGLGITLGERMGGQNPTERRAWLDRTIFAGMQAANRKIKFVYRAPLSADEKSGGTTSYDNDLMTRKQVEGLDVTEAFVEFKYNWSHGHSSPNLFMVHGGKLSDAYWNPVSDKLKAVWTVRNEDFFVLRWGQPDFVRSFLKNNTKDYVAGCFIGSEVFIPAKDYISKVGNHKNWQWHFQRQWLSYAVWGNLMYNNNTSDDFFESLLAEKFGKNNGGILLNGWKNASLAPLLFASYHQGNNDLSLYTESFGSYKEFKEFKLFDINSIISAPVLDTIRMVNIKQFIANNEINKTGIMNPLQLADSLTHIYFTCLKVSGYFKNNKQKQNATLLCEIADIEAWGYFSIYFADKLRAGYSLEKFRKTKDIKFKNESVLYLEKCLIHWKKYAETLAFYNQPSFIFHTAKPFSWTDMIVDVEKDIEIAKAEN
ncbi:MAG: hypothetical protein KA313_05190 [Pseudarcicella sp.]|nr:hypothetical protein [Pseudarcicella sp.]MBP6410473.1 hypothetical protein [Pseudarcicella sp.]